MNKNGFGDMTQCLVQRPQNQELVSVLGSYSRP